MFTEPIRIGCSVMAYCGEAAKYICIVGHTSRLVLYCYHLVGKHLPACHGSVPYLKGNRLVVNIPNLIWSLPV